MLAHLFDETDAGVHEERDAPDHFGKVVGTHLTGVAHRVEHTDRGGERVGDLFDRRRAGFLEVVRAHVDRIPLRHVPHRVADQVDGEPARRLRPEDVGAAREVLLDDVVLRGAGELGHVVAVLFRQRLVHAEQPHRGGVDRHRGVHRLERELVEEHPHLPEVGHRHADLADLAAGEDVIGVVAGLRGEVEGDGEAGLALRQVVAVELVRRPRRGMTGIRAHHPRSVGHGTILPYPRAGPRGRSPRRTVTSRSRRSRCRSCARAGWPPPCGATAGRVRSSGR